MGNLLVKNGLIIDGTGREAFKGDVVVAEDRIESVISSDTPPGKDSAAAARSPGFSVSHGRTGNHHRCHWKLRIFPSP